MRIKPVEHKYGKPKPKPITFGILKGYKDTLYGRELWGEYKNYSIRIIDYYKYDEKLIYVSDKYNLNWIKSKLIYIKDGIKQVMRSKAKWVF